MSHLATSRLPDFLVLGTYRSGTTWLHNVLKQHPKIYLPDEKELMFFSDNFEKGIDWYASFYAQADESMIAGEICPTYFSFEGSPARIRSVLGRPKLAVVLRRPSEQIASMHQLWVTRGTSSDSLEEALQKRHWLLHNVMYGQHLVAFEQEFGRGSVRVFLYDELNRDPTQFIRRVCDWIGVESTSTSLVHDRPNSSKSIRNRHLEYVIARGGRFLRKSGSLKAKALLNRTGLVQRIKRANSLGSQPVIVPPAVKLLIEEATRSDRSVLSERVNRDLSEWY